MAICALNPQTERVCGAYHQLACNLWPVVGNKPLPLFILLLPISCWCTHLIWIQKLTEAVICKASKGP